MMKRIATLFVACFFCFATLALAQGSGMTGDRPVQEPLFKKKQPMESVQPTKSQPAPDQKMETTDKKAQKKSTKTTKAKKSTKPKKSTDPMAQ